MTPSLDSDRRLLGRKDVGFYDLNGNWNFLNHIDAPLFTETHLAPSGTQVAYLFDHGDLIDLHIFDIGSGNDSIDISYPRTRIGFIGWSPDSLHFVIWLTDFSRNFTHMRPLVTTLGGPLEFLTDRDYLLETLRWVDSSRFLFVGNDPHVLFLQCFNAENSPCGSEIGSIDVNASSQQPYYDFTLFEKRNP